MHDARVSMPEEGRFEGVEEAPAGRTALSVALFGYGPRHSLLRYNSRAMAGLRAKLGHLTADQLSTPY